jgi:hypothetical protein
VICEPEVGILDASGASPLRQRKTVDDTEKLLLHEFQNCVHKIHMELDLVERGLVQEFKYADLISAVDSMNRSLEDLRVRLVRIEERVVEKRKTYREQKKSKRRSHRRP